MSDGVPFRGASHTAYEGERSLGRAEFLSHARLAGEFVVLREAAGSATAAMNGSRSSRCSLKRSSEIRFARRGRPAAVPIGEELLLERLVLEYVKINDPPEATRNPETELAPTSPAAFWQVIVILSIIRAWFRLRVSRVT